MGLPFDALSLAEARERVLDHRNNSNRCFLSTPNLNWLSIASTDNTFRNSVIHSDLSIADGNPIIWIAKLLKLPITERCAGSDLIESIRQSQHTHPIKIFFFGGEEGAGKQACKRLDQDPAGLQPCGYHNPGFGTIEEMSADETIEKVNEARGEFIVVSLGAKKGQAWIEHNIDRLDAPIISHLGAVVNFYAGTVQRSPRWLQMLGGEWLWRVYQEPTLYRRYLNDGLFLIGQLIQRILPYTLFLLRKRATFEGKSGSASYNKSDTQLIISLQGSMHGGNIDALRQLLLTATPADRDVQVDLSQCEYIDAEIIGCLLLLKNKCDANKRSLNLSAATPTVKKIFYYCGAEYLLSPKE